MRIKNVLLILSGLSCLLFVSACAEPQAQAGGKTGAPQGKVSPAETPVLPANTENYVHDWTYPTGNKSGKPLDPAVSEAERKRMLSTGTDNYERDWTLPADGAKAAKKPTGSHPDSPQGPPPDDTEEYLNDWTDF